MLPEDDRVMETRRNVLSVLMRILDLLNNIHMCICWCVNEIYQWHRFAHMKSLLVKTVRQFEIFLRLPRLRERFHLNTQLSRFLFY